MYRIGLGLALAAAWAGAALAADKPIYEAPAAWVKVLPTPASSAAAEAAPVVGLLADSQIRLGRDEQDFYSETSVQVRSAEGLQGLGNVALVWNPETDTLVIHKLHLIRGGTTIDLLANGQTFTVLRRETNLERAMLDGQLTAVFAPEGLQVGDILDLSSTIRRRDPLLGGHSQEVVGNARLMALGRLQLRVTWPAEVPVRWREGKGLPAGRETAAAGLHELVVEGSDLPPLVRPKGAPPRYLRTSQIDVSDFSDWSQVSALIAPLYAEAEVLPPDSPLKAETAKIRSASPDPKARAVAALQLVQQQVRYLYLGMNQGGLRPATADVTWSRRFADCKGKTALLLALLHELGMEAEPALVSSTDGDGLDQRLPMLAVFDHVIVRAVIGGKVYWLDGTRGGDRHLDRLQIPSFQWALPVQASGATLQRLIVPPLAEPNSETRIRLDASAGLDIPAKAHVETVLRGDVATAFKLAFDGLDPESRTRALREFWKNQFDFIDIASATAAFDPVTDEQHLAMDGAARMSWESYDGTDGRRYEVDDSVLGWKADFSRDLGPDVDAPFTVGYPGFTWAEETIVLPRHGEGFHTVGADLDRTLGGYELKRTSHIENGGFVMQASTRSLVPEVPAAEARASQAELDSLADDSLEIEAPPDYADSDQELASLAAAELTTSSQLGRRASAYRRRGQYDKALADYDKAAQLDPGNAAVLFNRALVLMEMKRFDEAAADLDKAIRIDPHMAPALTQRAWIYDSRGQYAQAAETYSRAIVADASNVDALVRRARVYLILNRPVDAEADAGRAIGLDPGSAAAYAERADARLLRKDTDGASADADKAISLDAKFEEAWRVRGDVLWAHGSLPEAIQAFSRALETAPQDSGVLMKRGSVYASMKLPAKAMSDFDEAQRIDPGNPAGLRARAVVLEQQGDLAGALGALDKAVALRPEDPSILLLRALMLARHGRNAEALQALQASIVIRPTLEAYTLSAQYRPTEDRKAALADLDAAMKLDPAASSPYSVLGKFRLADDDPTGAIPALEKAVQIEPDNPQPHELRAEAYDLVGRYDEAVKDLDALIAKFPGNAELLMTRCRVRAMAGRELDRALADCKAGAELDLSASALDERGFVKLRMGRYAEAIADYDAALKLIPSSADALYGRGLAERLSNAAEAGSEDIATANKLDPKIAARFARYGVIP